MTYYPIIYLFVIVAEDLLQGGDVLEAVAGDDPVVVVRRHEETCRVLTLGRVLDVVERRDASQVGEVFLVVTAAVVTDPGIAHSELVESEKVHHAEILRDLEIRLRYLGQMIAVTLGFDNGQIVNFPLE